MDEVREPGMAPPPNQIGGRAVPRPWVPSDVDAFAAAHADRFNAMSVGDLDAELHRLIERHEHHVDRECLGLNAGTNISNPYAAKLLASTIGNRASLGYPSAKYNKGTQYTDPIEILLMELLKRLFGADFAEIRVPSGSLANLYAYMATTKPGDRIMAFSAEAGGHATHHAVGAAGWYGLEIHPVPFSAERMDVDLNRLAERAAALKPKLIILAGSLCLFPYSVREVRVGSPGTELEFAL